MENASKALLMAGEVLISIIIVSALVLMFNSLTSYQKANEQNTKEAQVIEFNNIYEAYNVEDVRGNDLYTLINRVVDYNKRKSTEGTVEDEGQYLAYQPMEINVSLKADNGDDREKLTAPDGKQRIFTKNEFKINSTKNEFDSLFESITSLENTYTSGSLTNLTTGLTKIFVDNETFKNLSTSEQAQIIYNFNSAYGSSYLDASKISQSWEKINERSTIRGDVYTYYEYLQFTRAHFDCAKVKYNEGTGRIIYMEFKFNGKIS